MTKIALLGPAYAEYPTSVKVTINHVKYREGNGKALSLWTYRHDEEMLELLQNQIEKIGYVNLYVYSTYKKRKPWSLHGTKKVDHIFKVIGFEYYDIERGTPNPDYSFNDTISNEYEEESKGWYWVEEAIPIEQRDWESFRDYRTGEFLGKAPGLMFVPTAEWTYVIDD